MIQNSIHASTIPSVPNPYRIIPRSRYQQIWDFSVPKKTSDGSSVSLKHHTTAFLGVIPNAYCTEIGSHGNKLTWVVTHVLSDSMGNTCEICQIQPRRVPTSALYISNGTEEFISCMYPWVTSHIFNSPIIRATTQDTFPQRWPSDVEHFGFVSCKNRNEKDYPTGVRYVK